MIYTEEVDIGRVVNYVPTHARGNLNHPDCERGVITSFNDHAVFVKYGNQVTNKGAERRDLFWD